MSQLKRIDRIIEEVQSQVGGDVSALLGSSLTFSSPVSQIVSKEDCFADLIGSQIIANIDIDGDISGLGGLFLGKKDAILLGGTLIMLPDSELEEVVAAENYTEDIADSYGEIANIIVGACSKVFEESYPKNCRFIRKNVESIKPAKIDPDSDELLPNISYYRTAFNLKLGEKELGEMSFVLPASAFGLDDGEESGGLKEDGEHSQQETVETVETTTPSVVSDSPDTLSSSRDEGKTPTEATKNIERVDIKRIDKIIEQVQSQVEGDVSALLGSPLTFSSLVSEVVSKGDCFADLIGAQIIAHIDIDGDISGLGGMFLGKKDAVLLGGTLIMLPDSELEEVVAAENYTEDIADSYGEIANIIVGACSKVFEESYPKNCRFIRKTVESIKPAKIDPDSDELLPNISYYRAVFNIKLGDKELGEMSFVLPAPAFGLVGNEEEVAPQQSVEQPPQKVVETADSPVAGAAREGNEAASTPTSVDKAPVDTTKNIERIDKVLASCFSNMGSEIGMLLGVEAQVTNMELKFVTKEDFLADLMGKHVLSRLSIHTQADQAAYLCLSLPNAIHLGGVLIMLPPSELEIVVQEQEFDEDAKDAFGEIANIVAGVYTAQFGENHKSKARFIREEVEAFAPAKIDVESDELLKNQTYYIHSMDIEISGKTLGKMQFLLGAEDFDLIAPKVEDVSTQTGVEDVAESISSPTNSKVSDNAGGAGSFTNGAAPEAQGSGAAAQASDAQVFDILLVSNNQKEAAKISAIAEARGLVVGCVGFSENVQRYISPNLKAICLVMSEVNEQSFGLAIKLSSGASSPLIAVGPGWTRSTVIKAVKYGVGDILLAPAESADIESCLAKNVFV